MTNVFIEEMLSALPGAVSAMDPKTIAIKGDDELPSWFAVSDLAASSIGTAGALLARFAGIPGAQVAVDKRLASFWFGMTLRPTGWVLPSPWDPIAGDYRTKDCWIRLHTNAPHHRSAALSVLGDYADRAALEPAVEHWDADDLETAIIEAGGCAATMRDLAAWQKHPQGAVVSSEPLIIWRDFDPAESPTPRTIDGRPLGGLKILDLTRVLAGPVAGRFLAAFGANVLRIDPPDWDEPGVIPEVTLGKRCSGLNLKNLDDRAVFERLLSQADVLLHGYRPGALEKLGYDPIALRHINPSLIEVSLNAYGWSGPWSGRRGFDSLVQMSCGIAYHGMTMGGADRPVPLPVQALDHATGFLLAAAVLNALHQRAESGRVSSARLSLARVAHLLSAKKRSDQGTGFRAETEADINAQIEQTDWGPARRVKFPLKIGDITPAWDYPAGKLRSSKPAW
ncbi:MAG: acyl-CoA transferase [Hyphomicrobiales bacterium]|nr:acyl-CoA transferase [Hyphomicrobiales bacterium]MCP4997531.1 acyl-CoA transferase [Hyphomicrobiales bacterium]